MVHEDGGASIMNLESEEARVVMPADAQHLRDLDDNPSTPATTSSVQLLVCFRVYVKS